MNEANFELQAWHVITLLGTLLIGIFKDYLKHALAALLARRSLNKMKGQDICLLGEHGIWEEVTLIDYEQPVPFLRRGGVTIRHKAHQTGPIMETLSFESWSKLRIRRPH